MLEPCTPTVCRQAGLRFGLGVGLGAGTGLITLGLAPGLALPAAAGTRVIAAPGTPDSVDGDAPRPRTMAPDTVGRVDDPGIHERGYDLPVAA
ncbi:MAG: hypothetical protein GVY28_06575 [Alphaproteobacteria bacterium]|jgi:hypothetical protein|nr:hypothetical protein [Alphaproteobacteria bacterium]